MGTLLCVPKADARPHFTSGESSWGERRTMTFPLGVLWPAHPKRATAPIYGGNGEMRKRNKHAAPRPARNRRISIEAIDTYVRSCFSQETSPRVSELAGSLGVSRGTLTKAVRQLRNTTPGTYIKREQLACAKRLLRRGCSIDQTAHLAGYGTVRTFFRSFSDATGMTPIAFRAAEQNVSRRWLTRRDRLSREANR
jgi:AraC-like DNA-binding protein